MPATIYRPGVVVGDSRTGETAKFDGPYLVLRLMERLPSPGVFFRIGTSRGTVNIVPVDFVVEAMARLAATSASSGRTYHLCDPQPHSPVELSEMFARASGRRFVFVPVPLAVARACFAPRPVQRFFGMPQQALDYFHDPVRHDTTQASRDLGALGIECPRLADYLPRLVAFYRSHRDGVRSEAMTRVGCLGRRRGPCSQLSYCRSMRSGAWRSRKRRCRRSIVGCALEMPRTSARVAKPPLASCSSTMSPTWKVSVVITRAPPRPTLSATVSSSCSTTPHSSTSWIVKLTNRSVRGALRRSFGTSLVGWNSGPLAPGAGARRHAGAPLRDRGRRRHRRRRVARGGVLRPGRGRAATASDQGVERAGPRRRPVAGAAGTPS